MCCFFLGVTDVTNLLHNFAHFCFCTGWRRLIECLKLQVVFRKKATNHRALLHKMTHQDKASYDSTPPCIRICGIGSWITKIPSRTNPKEWVTFVIWMSHGISHRASDGTWLGLRCHMTASDVTWGKRMNVSHIWSWWVILCKRALWLVAFLRKRCDMRKDNECVTHLMQESRC